MFAEEVVARRDAHRDRVRPAGEPYLEAVEHDVHVDLTTATVASYLAEHHVAQRRPVDGLLAKDLLQRSVDVDRVDDRVTVRRDVEEGIRFSLSFGCLLTSATRLDERVEALGLDPFVGEGVLVRHGRLDGLRELTDRLCEGHGVCTPATLSVPLGQFGVCTAIDAGEDGSGLWIFHCSHLRTGTVIDERLHRLAPCAPLTGAKTTPR